MVTSDNTDKARELTKQGVELLGAGRLCEGQTRFEDALLLDPSYEPARAWLDNAEMRQARERVVHLQECRCGTQARLREQERQRIEIERASRRDALIRDLRRVLQANFLEADDYLHSNADGLLVPQDEYEALKAQFVQRWVRDHLGYSVDREQALAISTTSGDVQVTARAGSGKTRTLITRALFLQRHCGVSPQELLLLAFNKNAAAEMRERLAQTLGDALPHVMTFHALAYALVHPEQNLLFDYGATAEKRQSREVQEVIDEHIRSPEHHDAIRDLMLAHFRDDWERIVRGGFELTMSELIAFRRELPRESLRGEYVKSFGERVIANALFEYGVNYYYERNERWNGMNYRPDFTIPTGTNTGLIIEYLGLSGNPAYDDMSAKKREYWASRSGWTLIELTPKQLATAGAEAFVEALLEELRRSGVAVARRSEEEIWELIRRRAIDRFTESMGNFIRRCRKKDLTPDRLANMIQTHEAASTAERLFLDVGLEIYRAYLLRLSASNQEDFDGLMWRAAGAVSNGQTRFSRNKGQEQGDVARIRFVLVDEFQDFSQMFLDLMMAVRARNSRARFFFVGDDWQAINAFAGSELRFFRDFDEYFPDARRRLITTNYRSAKSIVDAGNAVMVHLGAPAAAHRSESGVVSVCRLDGFAPSASEIDQHGGDEITPAVLRVTWQALARGGEVTLLARRNGLPWYIGQRGIRGIAPSLSSFLEHVRSFLPEEDRGRLTASTVHRYKGRENETVIVLDAVQRSFPLIHPNWIFLRVFGDTVDALEEDERRLFYVAVTRARDSLFLFTEANRQSAYLASVVGSPGVQALDWEKLRPAPSLDGARLDIRVFDAYDVREQLKAKGYRWNVAGKHWQKSVVAEGFSMSLLTSESWAATGVRVEVHDEAGSLVHRHPPISRRAD